MDEKLDLIRKFNAELIAIAKTGLPIDLGMGESAQTLGRLLHESADRITAAVRSGQALDSAIAQDPVLSPTYRTALNAWLYGNQSASSLNSIAEPATARGRKRSALQIALVQPIVISVIAYLAMIFLCTFTLRSYQRLDAQFVEASSWSVVVLGGIAAAMWVWVPLVPVLLLFIIFRSYIIAPPKRIAGPGASAYGSRPDVSAYGSQPDASAYGSQHSDNRDDQATMADRIADYIENQIPLADAFRLAGMPPGMPAGIAAVEVIQRENASAEGSPSGSAQVAAVGLSPLMQWATAENRSPEARVAALRFVARTYRQLALLRIERARRWLPLILSAALGGVIVLVVALCVFAPPIEFLLRISQGDR